MNNSIRFQRNIHATCVRIGAYGILILGKSGSGKSDLALRLISQKKAKLVADDRVDISCEQGKIYASAPKSLEGLLEVRGVGIIKQPFASKTPVKLIIDLKESLSQIERMPSEFYLEEYGAKLPLLPLYPFEVSAVDKVVIKLKAVLDKSEK